MNTSSDSLWQLIRSLNRNEKLFFKRQYSEADPEQNPLYLRLFDALAAQKKYNEEALLAVVGPEINKKNIAFQKHYLSTQLNECLVNYANRGNIEQEIFKQVQLIRILRKKGLLNEALQLWEKTMRKARNNESFALLQLIKKEFEKMILVSGAGVKYDDLHHLFRSNIMSYDEYAEMITLRDLYAEVLMLKRKAHFDFDDELKAKISRVLQKVHERKQGLQSRSFWYRHYTRMCHATLEYLLNNSAASLPLIRDAVNDWWEQTEFLQSDTEHYIELLNMANYVGVMHGSFEYVEQVFNSPLNDLITDEVQKAHFEVVKYLALNKVYNKTARYREVAKLVKHMKTKYTRWEPLLNAEMNRTVCFSLGIACFVLDNYAESLQFIKRGVTYFKDGTREEQYIFAQLFLLLILYNMHNTKLFDAQYKSTYSYFYRKGKSHTFEKALMHCLHDSFYLNSYSEKAALFKEAVEKLESNPDNEVQKQILNIFNFHGWLLSQVQRIPYKEYVQRKYLREVSEMKKLIPETQS